MNAPDQTPVELLPYYREYLDQILRPRVVRLVEEVRANLATHAWNELLERLAEEQSPGASTDIATIQKMRTLLESTLGLKLGVHMHAEFADGPAAKPVEPRRPEIEVIERQGAGFPDNPLARAVGGVRRPPGR